MENKKAFLYFYNNMVFFLGFYLYADVLKPLYCGVITLATHGI